MGFCYGKVVASPQETKPLAAAQDEKAASVELIYATLRTGH